MFDSSFTKAIAVTDGIVFEKATRGLYVGAASNVTVVMVSDVTEYDHLGHHLNINTAPTVTFTGVPAKTILPVRVLKIASAPAGSLALF